MTQAESPANQSLWANINKGQVITLITEKPTNSTVILTYRGVKYQPKL